MDRQSLIEGELLSLCIEDEAFRANVLAKLKPDDFSGNNAKVFRKIALIHGEGKDMSRESIATVTGVDLPNHTDRDYEPIVDAMVERRTDTETMLAIERYYDESIKDSRMARANLLATLSEATADSSTMIRGGGIVDEIRGPDRRDDRHAAAPHVREAGAAAPRGDIPRFCAHRQPALLMSRIPADGAGRLRLLPVGQPQCLGSRRRRAHPR